MSLARPALYAALVAIGFLPVPATAQDTDWDSSISFDLGESGDTVESPPVEFDCAEDRAIAAASDHTGPRLEEDGSLIEGETSACDTQPAATTVEFPRRFSLPGQQVDRPAPAQTFQLSPLETPGETIARENRNCRATPTGFNCSATIIGGDRGGEAERRVREMLADDN